MPRVKMFFLGRPRIEYDEGLLDFTRRKAVALLSYLAVTEQAQSREVLAAFLWPDYDDTRARAGLRRVLAAVNKTPLREWIIADREMVALAGGDWLWVDVHQFNQLIDRATPETLRAAVDLYQGDFMTGFTLRNSAVFDEWQTVQTHSLRQRLMGTLEKLIQHYATSQQTQAGIKTAQRLLELDPLHEAVQRRLIRLYALSGQQSAAMNQYERYAALLKEELEASPYPETVALYQSIKDGEMLTMGEELLFPVYTNMPTVPTLVVGRDETVMELRHRLLQDDSLIIIQGWPGIGKTTLSAMLAHDDSIRQHFEDGILWTSLGQYPNLMAKLVEWGRTLGYSEIERLTSLEEMSSRLVPLLRDRRVLLVIDDVWEIEHMQLFRVGGPLCGLLITTRLNDVAQAAADHPDRIYKMPILSEIMSVELLRTLAPQVVECFPDEVRELVDDLEGLPLALQVAGRLLHAEFNMGWGITDLLDDLRHGVGLLEMQAPADRMELATQTTPTIATLLRRSVERLSPEMQERFALLGVFAPKPASFTLEAIQAVWVVDDPRPALRVLVGRGLVEPTGEGLFQIHALLVMLAQSMFEN